jgi:hypothetical protein
MLALIWFVIIYLPNRNIWNVGDIFLPHLQRALRSVKIYKTERFVGKGGTGILSNVWNVGTVS